MSTDVVVGVDGSEESLAAVDWAADEAAGRDGTLRLVSATRWEKQPHVVMPSYAAEDWGRRLLEEAEQRVYRRRPRLQVTTEEVEDAPASVLLAAAEEAPLLVLGSRGLGEAASFLIGSVGQAVMAQAKAPVVLVRPGPGRHGPTEKVVLGLDVRHPSDELLAFAFAFAFDAAARRTAVLRIVHTWRFPAAHRNRTDDDHGAGNEKVGALSSAIGPWRSKYPNLQVETDVAEGRAGEHLVATADTAGLLVVGRRWPGTGLGSHVGAVTHAAVHHAPCPVAVVPHS